MKKFQGIKICLHLPFKYYKNTFNNAMFKWLGAPVKSSDARQFSKIKTTPVWLSLDFKCQTRKMVLHFPHLITTTRNELNYLCSAVPSWQEKAFRGQGMYYNVTITSCMSCSNTCKQLLAQYRMSCQAVIFPQIIQTKSTRHFIRKKNTPVQLPRPFTNLKNDRLAIKIQI